MGRQVEVPGSPHLPRHLTLAVGDVALFWATGAQLQEGEGVVVLASPYLRTAPADTGGGPRPAGLPNTVRVEACRPGRATLRLFTASGMLGQAALTQAVEITVEAPRQPPDRQV